MHENSILEGFNVEVTISIGIGSNEFRKKSEKWKLLRYKSV